MAQKEFHHKAICDELNILYAQHSHHYGDSFHQAFVEEGTAASRILLGDKFNLLKILSSGQPQNNSDNAIRNTLMEIANYAIMTILEIEEDDKWEKESW